MYCFEEQDCLNYSYFTFWYLRFYAFITVHNILFCFCLPVLPSFKIIDETLGTMLWTSLRLFKPHCCECGIKVNIGKIVNFGEFSHSDSKKCFQRHNFIHPRRILDALSFLLLFPKSYPKEFVSFINRTRFSGYFFLILSALFGCS